ncbi:hypothetical protein H072_282 [Dactylellina haptotyla CBS 200.50]|uniref:ER membrane protein complex subunit 5 n=1 Tax=Dactylellina haptotyla (strain CBS 200.50) TaxID=1284197 RepID=S8AS40_DACHA|nr:hypothetical protein H072_282 [Dactylellina haptotyla CBS 200.50]
MSLPSKLLIAFSSLLLAHACYSAHEHSLLSTTTPSSSPAASSSSASSTTAGSAPAGSSLPLDMTLETLFSVSLLLLGLVLSGWELKPISLRAYAGMLESGKIQPDGVIGGKKGRGVFDALEERPGFLDIRKQRKEFTEWVKLEGSS